MLIASAAFLKPKVRRTIYNNTLSSAPLRYAMIQSKTSSGVWV